MRLMFTPLGEKRPYLAHRVHKHVRLIGATGNTVLILEALYLYHAH